jgi:uncharacterized protein (TIGR02996 family)
MQVPPLDSEGAALLRAARDAPEDDTARLVFADWLDENGHAPAAARLRFWVGVRAQVRVALAIVDSVFQNSLGPPNDWRDWAEMRERRIQADWVSLLCAVEVERLVLAEPDLPAIILHGTDQLRALISERSDSGRQSLPLCAELEWVAVGCVPRPDGQSGIRFPFAFPDARRGVDLVRDLADIINSGTETPERALAARRCLWLRASIVFRTALQTESAGAPP